MTIEAATKRAEIIAKLAEVEDPSRFDRILVGQLARRIVEDLSSLRSPDGGAVDLFALAPPAPSPDSFESHACSSSRLDSPPANKSNEGATGG